MKKLMTAMSVVLLVAVSLGLWGCGDDDPAEPPTENCSITVTNPLAGDSFQPGDAILGIMNIRWTESGDADLVKLELLKNGALVEVIHPSVLNNGFYRWTSSNYGAPNGDDFAIRVTALSDDSCTSTSGMFTMINTVDCALSFTNNFPDLVNAGDVLNLTWDSFNTTGSVDIQLRKQDQSLAYIVVGTEDDGSYEWIADSFHNGSYSDYFLRILDNDLEDTCYADADSTFAMVDDDICFIDFGSPVEGVIWDEGTTENIMITVSSEVEFVDLRLYSGIEFIPGATIVTDYPVADLPYVWNVMDFGNSQVTTMYRVRAINSADQYCVGNSENFTIISQD